MTPRPRPFGASRLDLELTRLEPVKVFTRALSERVFPPGGMTGRERVRRAVEFEGPDRVPRQKRDFWFLFHVPPMSWQPPDGYYPYVHPGAVQSRAWRWKKRKDSKWLKEDRIAIDEFGTVWKASGRTSLGETLKGPLQDGWELLEDYKLPDMKDWDRFKGPAALSRLVGGGRYRLGVDVNSIWERFRFLRGFENAMMDLVQHPDEVHRLLDMITDMTLDIIGNFKKAGAHGFMLVDDWGTQDRSFISPRHFEEFFKPRYKRLAGRCHQLGMHLGMHSCGAYRELVGHMIEAGLDFLQLDSPNMNGLDWLSENAAGRICLFCSVDIQEVYPTNDPALIEDYIREMVSKLSSPKGGLVAWPYAETWVIGVGRKAVKLEERLWDKYGTYQGEE